MHSVEWRGREVENPILRRLLVCGAVVLGLVGIAVATVALSLGTVLAAIAVVTVASLFPFTLLLHLSLRVCGRRGFLTRGEGRRFNYTVDLEGFRKAP